MNLLSAYMRRPVAAAVIISLFLLVIPRPSHGAPVVAVVIALAASTVAVNAVDCHVHIYWGCGGSGGGGAGGSRSFGFGGNSSGGSTGTGGSTGGIGFTAATVRNSPSGNSNGNANGFTGGSGSVPTPCQTQASNSCGMHGSGFVGTNGMCSAAVPPNTACPAPTGTFYATPDRVRTGNTTDLQWNITNATICSITGGSLSASGLQVTGMLTSKPITHETQFSLTCSNGTGGTSQSFSTSVAITPSYQEN